MIINNKKVDPASIEFDDIEARDYPDFSNAYVTFAEFNDGQELTEKQLEILTESEFAYEQIFNQQLWT